MSAAISLTERPSFVLAQLGHLAGHRFAALLAPLQLQPRQFGLLNQLAAREGQSQQQLADALSVRRNVMVALVDELEARGLIERRAHPSDRRAHALYLTPQAAEVLGQAGAIADAHDASLLADLNNQERELFLQLLQRVRATQLAPGDPSQAAALPVWQAAESVAKNTPKRPRKTPSAKP